MRVLVAPQELKGSLTAADAAAAISTGVRRADGGATIDLAPMADGGPGTLDAIVSARGGVMCKAVVHDPLYRVIEARWGHVGVDEAIIEMAEASGILRLKPNERNATTTTTYGVGELIRAALDAGCRRFVVAVGGSATNDGGAGMASALGVRFIDRQGEALRAGGLALSELDHIDATSIDPRLKECLLEVAVDVRNPLVGNEGASAIYGPQKGATPKDVLLLDAALRRYAYVVRRDLGIDIDAIPGGGAAGGLAAGLIAFCDATLQSGAALVGKAVRLYERANQVDLVLTGEGSLDGQTKYGKAVIEVVHAAVAAGVPVVALAGQIGDGVDTLYDEGLTAAISISPGPIELDEALRRGHDLLVSAAEAATRIFLAAQQPVKSVR